MVNQSVPHVAILIETSRTYGRGLLSGIRKFLTTHGPWSVFVELRALESTPPEWLKGWQGDGILTRTASQKMADLVQSVGVPTVELRATRLKHPFPFIGVDNQAVGRLVAEHFLDRGFQHFAFYELDTEVYFEERRKSFTETLQSRSFSVIQYQNPGRRERPKNWEEHQARLVDWLKGLPKPVGIMACTDQLGFWLLDACRRAGISVPEEIAVVGCEDDETLCEMANPPLSSVQFNAERIGFDAAQMLSQMMSGGTSPPPVTLVQPLGLRTRQSSEILLTDDPQLRDVLKLIRERACSGIRVSDLLEQTDLSRSSLERKIRQLLGRSPQAEINRIRMERVRTLLQQTDWTLAQIAARTGFSSPQILCERFKAFVGQTPGDFRASQRPDKNP